MTLGVNDPKEVLEGLTKEVIRNPDLTLAKALKGLREALQHRANQ